MLNMSPKCFSKLYMCSVWGVCSKAIIRTERNKLRSWLIKARFRNAVAMQGNRQQLIKGTEAKKQKLLEKESGKEEMAN